MKRNHTLLSLLIVLCLSSCKTFLLNSQNNTCNNIATVNSENTGSAQKVNSFEFTSFEAAEIAFAPTSFLYPENPTRETGLTEYSENQVMLYAESAKKYAKEKGFDTTCVFIANMAVLPNKKRFYVVNMMNMTIETTGLVSHGRGKGRSIYSRQYSNSSGSNCTSLGRYKISRSYKGTYGFSYRLTGLDTTNSNAESRGIVLHSMGCIPEKEGFAPACVSEGCPSLSKQFFDDVTKIIESKKKPLLLWIFDSLLEEPVLLQTKTKVSPESSIIAARL
jgi:L,D-transpeptidase catalytic domain